MSGVEGAIAEARDVFVAALRAGDAQAAASVYADDARLLAPSAALLEGRSAIEDFWRTGIEAGVIGVELGEVELDPHGVVAYEVGRYALKVRPEDGQAVVDRGTYLLVHERQDDDSWLRAAEAFNPDVASVAVAREGRT